MLHGPATRSRLEPGVQGERRGLSESGRVSRVGAPSIELAVHEYQPFIENLQRLREVAVSGVASETELDAALNGMAARELRRLVPVQKRRAAGAFFTPTHLTEAVSKELRRTLGPDSVVYDPACGAGDLLLAALRVLPDSVASVSERVLGRDLWSEFTQAARIRLSLEAWRTGSASSPLDCSFSRVRAGDGLSYVRALRSATHVVANPPFGRVRAPSDIDWASGLVSEASVFTWRLLLALSPGARLVAILPDVLRSGSNYRKWRTEIGRVASIEHISLHDQFDSATNVHATLVSLRRRERQTCGECEWTATSSDETVGDRFEVRVGRVVDFRDNRAGADLPYLHPGNFSVGRIDSITDRRNSERMPFLPPFVAVRRMSRADDPVRARAALVTTPYPVAVDNHLVALRPLGGGVDQCERLLDVLADPRTSAWLNWRIRCRHLTVEALRQLPWTPQGPPNHHG